MLASNGNQDNEDLIRTLLNLPPSRTVFTKSQLAYAAVRKAIVTHSLPAGTPLDETYLLALFPFGRTPLREALKRLNYEGLLSWPSHQAPTVLDVSMHDMQYLYETRKILEPTIVVLAARRATEADHAKLELAVQAMVKASKTGSVYESVEQDYALHATIANATQNAFLAESSNHLNRQSLRMWFRNQTAHGISRIHELHLELVSAIVNRDEELSEKLALHHIASSLNRQTTSLRELNILEPS